MSLVCFEAGIMKWTLLKNQLCAQYIMTSLHHCKKVTFNNCIVRWRLGAWSIQKASTIGSQFLDGDFSHGWQILAIQPWAPTQERKQVPITLNKQWKEGGKGCGNLPGQWVDTSPHNAASSHSRHTQERLKQRAYGIPTHAHS